MGEIQTVTAFETLALFCSKHGCLYEVSSNPRDYYPFCVKVEFDDGTEISSSDTKLDSAIYKLLEKLED